LFEDETTILLNHGTLNRTLAEGFNVPRTVTVSPLGQHAGRGEDDPIWSMRLKRDGWQLKRRGKYRMNKGDPRIWIEYVEKELLVKQQGAWTLEMLLAGIKETDGPWYLIEYRVVDSHGNVVLDLGRLDWADWSRDGDLLFAKEGCLFRARMNRRTGPARPAKLIDLSGLKFEPVEPKVEATRWGGQPVVGSLLI
jgi:hypothetical protein